MNPALFVAAARLVAVLWLQLSGTVEHIFELELETRAKRRLRFVFEGQRTAAVQQRRSCRLFGWRESCQLG